MSHVARLSGGCSASNGYGMIEGLFILSVLAKNLAADSEARSFASTLRMTSLASCTRRKSYTLLNRDRGRPFGRSPPTPPYVRVRIRRFGSLNSSLQQHTLDAQPIPEANRQRDAQRRAAAQTPRAMATAGGLRRQVFAHASFGQFHKPTSASGPVAQYDAAQSSSDPFVQRRKDAGCLAEAEVTAPTPQVFTQRRHDLPQTASLVTVGLPLHDPSHQPVVVDSIEELLQIDVHHPRASLGDVALWRCAASTA